MQVIAYNFISSCIRLNITLLDSLSTMYPSPPSLVRLLGYALPTYSLPSYNPLFYPSLVGYSILFRGISSACIAPTFSHNPFLYHLAFPIPNPIPLVLKQPIHIFPQGPYTVFPSTHLSTSLLQKSHTTLVPSPIVTTSLHLSLYHSTLHYTTPLSYHAHFSFVLYTPAPTLTPTTYTRQKKRGLGLCPIPLLLYRFIPTVSLSFYPYLYGISNSRCSVSTYPMCKAYTIPIC